MERTSAPAQPPPPLRAVFEGQSSHLTALLHTTMAILFFVYVLDLRLFFLVAVGSGDGWKGTLLFYVGCMVSAAFAGALTVGSLSLNLRPLTKESWRARICTSIAALVLVDLLIVDPLIFLVDALYGFKEQVASVPATAFISALAIAGTVWFNILYVRMFGCCFCFSCCGERTVSWISRHADKFDQGEISRNAVTVENRAHLCADSARTDPYIHDCPSVSRPDSSSDMQLYRDSSCVSEQDNIETAEHGGWPRGSLRAPVEDTKDRSAFQAAAASSSQNRMQTTSEYGSMTSTPKEVEMSKSELNSGMQANRSENLSEGQTNSKSQLENAPSTSSSMESAAAQSHASLSDLHRWDTMKLIEIGSAKLQGRQFGCNRPSSSTCEIVIEEPEKVERTDKTPRAASDKFSIASVVQKFMTGEEDNSTPFDLSQWSLQNLWKLVSQESGRFRYSVWMKSAFCTSVIILIYTYIRAMSVLTDLSDLYKENRDRFNSNRGALEVFLEGAGWLDGIDDVTKTTVIKLYSIVDAVALDLKHVCWIGYSFGFVVGLYSLVTVLVQHKRMSLAVADGLKEFQEESAQSNDELKSPWRSFQKKYRVLGASRFLGILVSTAVVQLHIVGFTVSVLICLFKNADSVLVVVGLVGVYLLATSSLLVIDSLLVEFLRSALVAEDDTGIIHPRWFNFWMVTLSMVYLVIGLLDAVWRLIFLMSTTILSLNRLDVTYFVKGKQLDSGHNAFMSMLVLTVLVQEDHVSFHTTAQNSATNDEKKQETLNAAADMQCSIIPSSLLRHE